MARTEGQKVKLLVLADLLARETDGAHGLTVPQIIAALAARGIAAERKRFIQTSALWRNSAWT